MLLNIEHTTTYRYVRPVRFGPHRLTVLPLGGHDINLRRFELEISIPHRLRWIRDAFDNSVAVAEFQEPAAELRLRMTCQIEQLVSDPFDFLLEPEALTIPFEYQPERLPAVASYLQCQHPEDGEPIRQWIRPFLDAEGRAGTTSFFAAVAKAMPLSFQYQVREEPGVQSPATTLRRRSGSCRDFALLFMEAARLMGVAARYVSGYLCRSNAEGLIAEASEATHAWAEVFLPGAGWKGFDPTCGILAADYHVRTAVTRAPDQAVPVAGTFEGAGADYLGMEVRVHAVRASDSSPGS